MVCLPFRPFARLARFARDTHGGLTVEAVLALPMLTFLYASSFVWFDAFRSQNTNLKATYTISDMISRETLPLTDNYLNGIHMVFDYLADSAAPSQVRITTVKCTEDCDKDSRKLEVCWSWATSGKTPHTEASFDAMEASIPVMPIGDTVVVAETFMLYRPWFEVGLPEMTMDNFIVTRPRFAPQINYNEESCY